jgi:hypothetical protein
MAGLHQKAGFVVAGLEKMQRVIAQSCRRYNVRGDSMLKGMV